MTLKLTEGKRACLHFSGLASMEKTNKRASISVHVSRLRNFAVNSHYIIQR